MSIIKVERDKNYTVIPNDIINHPDLTFKAKGVLIYLLSKPNDWKVYVSDIAKHGGEGESAIRSALKELEAAGYLQKELAKDQYGKWKGYDYTVSDTPYGDFPYTGNQNYKVLKEQSTEKDNNGVFEKTLCEYSFIEDVDFFDFRTTYEAYYKSVYGESHPYVTDKQYEFCYNQLVGFIAEHGLEWQDIMEMIPFFFHNVKQTDHNINHFCTEGILKNRMYEAGLGGYTDE